MMLELGVGKHIDLDDVIGIQATEAPDGDDGKRPAVWVFTRSSMAPRTVSFPRYDDRDSYMERIIKAKGGEVPLIREESEPF